MRVPIFPHFRFNPEAKSFVPLASVNASQVDANNNDPTTSRCVFRHYDINLRVIGHIYRHSSRCLNPMRFGVPEEPKGPFLCDDKLLVFHYFRKILAFNMFIAGGISDNRIVLLILSARIYLLRCEC